VKRPAALIVALLFVSAQPSYVCALRCMLGHGQDGAAAHVHAGHMHDSAPDAPDCHGAHLTDGALGVLSAPSPAVVSVSIAVPMAPIATTSLLEATRRAPRGILLTPEPPPPRL